MRRHIGWRRRDAEGKAYEVEVSFYGGKIRWRHQYKRFDERETYEPDEEDWERLVDAVEKRVKRGLMGEKEMKLALRKD